MKASGTVQNVTSHNYLKQSGVKKYSVGGCGEKNTAWVVVVKKIQRGLWSQHP